MSLLSTPALIKPIVAALVFGFAAGSYSGYSVKGKLDVAEQAEAVRKEVDQARESINKSVAMDQTNIDNKSTVEVRYETKIKEVVKYVPKTSTVANCKDSAGNSIPTTLAVTAVRMLNDDAQDGSDLQPASNGNAESQTATEVGLRELSEYVLKIKQQYEELASDHNTLVEYDTWYKQEIDMP